ILLYTKGIVKGISIQPASAGRAIVPLQSDNEICKLCGENCKLSHRSSSLLILTKTILGGF
ncbi:MAG: hypothetical protein M0Q99_07470, partial [Candidatus Cloacimonetes bacterium]|nr:hypothetical protein [Candidatus Cloacimonadota bacterium]